MGIWEEYDACGADHRVGAMMDLYDGAGSCGAQRSWQGWVSPPVRQSGSENGHLWVPATRNFTISNNIAPTKIIKH